jgi:hypothetical protein
MGIKLVPVSGLRISGGDVRTWYSAGGIDGLAYMAPGSDMRRMIHAAGITEGTVHQVPEWALAVIVCIGGDDSARVAVLRACKDDFDLRCAVFALLCVGAFDEAAELCGVRP